ncbi:carboxymuconolactone decarboxylase family protein [Salinirubellus salinus]|uniref:Carboxymuconolactone decarboxylase family protein n=1 Tax=Salinirubellus salinus TaxID=1364945 RepID=A0A9E7UB22_9EURY|nr:carboxymuconolactone decarboxylase family protein [Salinirubellus salinus]UWM54768.1 carboxymuconolactone decarboxylase family protein [Salinirubellus salinus]
MASKSETRDVDVVREDIEETLGFVPGFWELNDEDLVNEWPNFKRHTIEETAIPPKYKEFIGLAVAANLKCPYCQEFHMGAAKLHGATDEELREVAYLASFTARYSAILHGMNYDIDTFSEEFARIGDHMEQHMDAAADD